MSSVFKSVLAGEGKSNGPSLLVQTLSGESWSIPLGSSRVSIGRNADNTVSLPDDSSLSRNHLAFYEEGGCCFVEDLGSKNGTFVNGEIVQGCRNLRSGDVVLAGDVTVTFQHSSYDARGVSFDSGVTLSAPIAAQTMLADILRTRSEVEQPEKGGERRALWAFIRAGRGLAGRRPLPELFSATLDFSLEAVGAERGALLTLDDSGRLVVQASKGGPIQVSSRLKDPVLKEKTSLLVQDAQSLSSHQTVIRQGIHSLMVVPLQTEGRVIGLIYLDSVDADRRFDKADLELLTVMANVASIQIERERWEMQRQLLVSENVERLRRLAAAVSHEFNTPLGALKSAIDSLLKSAARGSPAYPDKKERMARIQADLKRSLDAALGRMEEVIGRIQRFTNLDGGDRQVVDLNEIVTDVVAIVAEPSVEITVATETLAPLRCDRHALSTSLLSLLGFADEMAKKEASTRRIQVSTHATDAGSKIRIHALGPTLTPEVRQRLFTPSFEIADGRIAAGNWSLFSALQVIQSLGGAIDARSEASEGLVLTVHLPQG